MHRQSRSISDSRWLYFVGVAVLLQCLASLVFNVRVSHFVADDINAIELAHQTDFLTFIATPVDIHRVPLHRAVNYVLHHALPMNYLAATAFMLTCHLAALAMLYLLLQRLNPAPRLNATLILLYALNHAVLEPLHWWSAGLHRFPLILFTVLSCYCFVCFHQQQQLRFAVGALGSAVLGAGFFIKAILMPAYWAALLFCLMDFRRWREYGREYVLIGAGFAATLLYTAWYMHGNPHDTIQSKTTLEVIATGLSWGLSMAAQLPLQLDNAPLINVWVNGAWLLLLAACLICAHGSWRAITAGLAAIVVNLLIIVASSRATMYGPLIMLMPHYYYELLFLMVIFVSLVSQQLAPRLSRYGAAMAGNTRVAATLLVVGTLIYAATGWHTTLASIKPGPNEAHWQSARYIRNLRASMQHTDIATLNLIEKPVPRHFRAGTLFPKLLPTSTFLSWFGWHPPFQQTDRPLSFINDLGHIEPLRASGSPIPLLAAQTLHQPSCAGSALAAGQQFTADPPLIVKRGYLTLDYSAASAASAILELDAGEAKLLGAQIDFNAGTHRTLVDLTRFAQLDAITLDAVRIVHAAPGVCLREMTLTHY